MSKKIIKLLIILALISALVSYLFTLNPHSVAINYGEGKTWEGPLPLLVLFCFGLGALLAGIIATYFGVRHAIADWQHNRKLQRIAQTRTEYLAAREAVAAGIPETAVGLYRKILSREPDDVLARVELAKALSAADELNEALTVVEEGRKIDAAPESNARIELLLLAGELNLALNRPTAAYDSLTLVLDRYPKNQHVLRQLITAAIDLERYSDAIRYQQQLIKVSPHVEYDSLQEELATLELTEATHSYHDTPAQYDAALADILRRHKEFPLALSERAFLLVDDEDAEPRAIEEATALWMRAYKASHNVGYLHCIASTWLRCDQPAKALSYVRNALRQLEQQDATAQALAYGKLFLTNFLLHLEMIDDARRELQSISAELTDLPEICNALTRARLARREGRNEEAFTSLQRAVYDVSPETKHLSFDDEVFSRENFHRSLCTVIETYEAVQDAQNQ